MESDKQQSLSELLIKELSDRPLSSPTAIISYFKLKGYKEEEAHKIIKELLKAKKVFLTDDCYLTLDKKWVDGLHKFVTSLPQEHPFIKKLQSLPRL